MKLLKDKFINDKKENNNKVDSFGNIIQMVEGKVIDVGPEVTGKPIEENTSSNSKLKTKRKISKKPNNFSYRYEFKNPITGDVTKAYDDLIFVEIGEQIYDIGDKVPLIFSDKINNNSKNNFTITRKIIFPEIINKKKRKIKIVKALYLIFLFLSIFICMCSSASNQPVQNNAEVENVRPTY